MPTPRLITLALVAIFAATTIASRNVPDLPDLMVKTLATYGGGHSFTNIIYLKGARARREMKANRAAGVADIDVTQCDQHRTLELNSEAKTYAYRPIIDYALMAARLARGEIGHVVQERPEGPTVTITTDAVDTGERRAFEHYTARHVITTRKVEPSPGAQAKASMTKTDGWYLDLPDASCTDPAEQYESFAVLGGFGSRPPDHIEFKQLGTARRGYAIEETSTHVEGTSRSETTRCELIDLSEAPLDDALFDVPADYLPALPLARGGFDMRRQDTLVNRLGQYYEAASAWVQYFLNGRPTYGHGYDD